MGKFGIQHGFKKAEALKRIEKEKQAELIKKSKISLQKTKQEFKERYLKICKVKGIEPETAAKKLPANTIAEIRAEFNLSRKEFGYAIRLFKSIHLTSFDPSFVSESYFLDKRYQLLFRIVHIEKELLYFYKQYTEALSAKEKLYSPPKLPSKPLHIISLGQGKR